LLLKNGYHLSDGIWWILVKLAQNKVKLKGDTTIFNKLIKSIINFPENFEIIPGTKFK
jgi:hypothetical protein